MKPSHISTSRARDRFSDLVSRVAYGQTRIVLTRWGRPIAALVPMKDFSRLRRAEEEELLYEELNSQAAGECFVDRLQREMKSLD